MSNDTDSVNATGLPENLYPSRGFARIPQTMSLQQEYDLQLSIAKRACGRMRVIEALMAVEQADAFESQSGGGAVPPTMFALSRLHVVRMCDGSLVAKSGPWFDGGPDDAA